MWLRDLANTFRPSASPQDGPLPLLLVFLTLLTGLVDALSYLMLGHVFVANMTGNVVFLGFAIPGVGGFWAPASIAAIVFFGLGALAGGRWLARPGQERGLMLARATAAQAVLMAAGWVAWLLTQAQAGAWASLLIIAPLSAAMGLQNHVARALKVADLTTTVLTLTITGLFADSATPGGVHQGRRILSIAAMALGAALGAWAVLNHAASAVFAACVVIPSLVSVFAWRWRGPAHQDV